MLYSEIKERENRFITALKISFPFLILLGIFVQFAQYTSTNLFLLIILIPLYVYYTVYLIRYGFRSTMIDPVTQTFNRQKMLSKIESIKHPERTTLVLIHVTNVSDINERYGINNSEFILKELIVKLQHFLKKNKFMQVSIGRYSSSTFIFFVRHPLPELKHLMTIFTKNLQNTGIENIEVKLNFSLINANYDTSLENVIEKLFILLDESEKKHHEKTHFKPNVLKKFIDQAIEKNQIFFRYQPVVTLNEHKTEVYEILTRIESSEYGTLSKLQIQKMINYTRYEKEFDEKIFELLLHEIEPLIHQTTTHFSLEISPVVLRNYGFKRFIEKMCEQKGISPQRFILEITEKRSYEEMQRFAEIVQSYRDAGFLIALGNFGGNNASVEYLKLLPVDMVKFDIEFTKNCHLPKYELLMQQYIELCKKLHVKTMVKFIDKAAHLEKMKILEPDYIQGFSISKPKTIGDLNEIR